MINPNLHQILVHFTIALLVTSTLLFLAAEVWRDSKYREDFLTTAVLNFGLGRVLL